MTQHTQEFMGRNSLIDRLAAQTGNRETAIKILQSRGHVAADGKTLTAEGKKRDAMTAEERAKDRAAKYAKSTPAKFKYNPKTNRATRK